MRNRCVWGTWGLGGRISGIWHGSVAYRIWPAVPHSVSSYYVPHVPMSIRPFSHRAISNPSPPVFESKNLYPLLVDGGMAWLC